MYLNFLPISSKLTNSLFVSECSTPTMSLVVCLSSAFQQLEVDGREEGKGIHISIVFFSKLNSLDERRGNITESLRQSVLSTGGLGS